MMLRAMLPVSTYDDLLRYAQTMCGTMILTPDSNFKRFDVEPAII